MKKLLLAFILLVLSAGLVKAQDTISVNEGNTKLRFQQNLAYFQGFEIKSYKEFSKGVKNCKLISGKETIPGNFKMEYVNNSLVIYTFESVKFKQKGKHYFIGKQEITGVIVIF